MKLHFKARSGGLQSAVGLRRPGSRRSLISAFLFLPTACMFAAPVVIGSKKFTESYVLGEIAKHTLTDAGIPAEHRQGM
ncbi:MAG TPA: glycine betaine ABC transporter substrate-binding protein, partial [Candidatus Udaeobacter sp.]